MVNEKELRKKVADFFNALNVEEVVAFRKFTMTRKWGEFFFDRLHDKKVE